MNVLRKLRKQMKVISNHRFGESLGGYSVYFVGAGERFLNFQGWWPTRLDFYSLDAAGLSQRVRVNGRGEFMREKNMVSLFADNVLYEECYEAPRKFEDAWIVFRPTGQDHPLKRLVGRKGYCLFQDDHQIIRQRIHEVSHIASADVGLRLMAQAAFFQILAHLVQASTSEKRKERLIGPLVQRRGARNTLKAKILSLLETDLQNDISVEELAQRLSVSRSTLSHRFSSEMGETMVQLKRRLRIQRAQQLMADPNRQLKEIAFEVGFDDPAYFSRLFTRTVGVSPSEYRKLILQGWPGSVIG